MPAPAQELTPEQREQQRRFVLREFRRSNEGLGPPRIPRLRQTHWDAVGIWVAIFLLLGAFWLVAVPWGVSKVYQASQGIVTPGDGVKIVIMETQKNRPPETEREAEYFKARKP